MTKIIPVVCRKGGTGKTTTALNIAAALAFKGKKVLAMDLDRGCDLTRTMLPKDIEDKYKTLVDGFRNDDLNICTYKSNIDNVDIIPSSERLDILENRLQNDEFGVFAFSQLFAHFDTTRYDYIIIDTPPFRNILSTSAFVVSDFFIHPVDSFLAIQKIPDMLNDLSEIKETLNTKLNIGSILINKNISSSIEEKALETMKKGSFKDYILKTSVPMDQNLNESIIVSQSIFSYAPDSDGGKAYMEVTEELLSKWESEE